MQRVWDIAGKPESVEEVVSGECCMTSEIMKKTEMVLTKWDIFNAFN